MGVHLQYYSALGFTFMCPYMHKISNQGATLNTSSSRTLEASKAVMDRSALNYNITVSFPSMLILIFH